MRLPDNFTLQNGKYRIIRFISSGGFGCTYEAVHVLFNNRVAIKEFFFKEYCNRDPNSHEVSVGTESRRPLVDKLKEKFIREACSLNRLSHHGIVSVHDVFEENGTAYYVMDYIEGKSIAELVKRGPLSEAVALRYMRQVCEALRYVHSKSILHLDIKPGNIMVDGDGNAILIDFGTSKQYDMVSGENTSSLLGLTPGYAPPEQMRHKVTNFTPATDIYALGATLYKMLTGVTPVDSMARASGDEELDPLPMTISENVRHAIQEAMRLKKAERPQSIDEFMGMLFVDKPQVEPVVTVEPVKPVEPVVKDDDTLIIDSPSKPQPEPTPSAPVKDPVMNHADPVVKPTNDPVKGPNRVGSNVKPTKKKRWLIPTLVAVGVILCVVLGLLVVPQLGTKSTPTGSYNGHDYVDLGLSVKWATCNIGAYTPNENGDYFAWGENRKKSDYSAETSDWYDVSYNDLKDRRVIDSKGNLTPQYDVAAVNWGGSWRMPTKEEIQELIDKCTWTWIWLSLEGKKGYKVTGPNGNSIFLPFAGYRDGSSLYYVRSDDARYWSSSAYNDSDYASCLYLNSICHDISIDNTYLGQSVRPVAE